MGHPSPERRGRAPSPGPHACSHPSVDQPAAASSGLRPAPKGALNSHRCTEAARVPASPAPLWAHGEPTPSVPRLTVRFPAVPGLTGCLSPNLRVQAALSASIPRPSHQVSCLQTVPAQDQGPSVPQCCEHSAPPPPPLAFPVVGGVGVVLFLSDSRRTPLFRGTKAGDGEGRGPFGPVQARLVRVKAILSAPLSSDDGFSLPPWPRVVIGWAAWEGSSASLEL